SRVRPADAPATDHVRFELTTPEPGGPEYPQGSASLSPDGRQMGYAALSGSKRLLWVHSLSTGTAHAIESTDGIGPAILVWSPDSRHLAFSAPSERRLKRVAATGGPSQVICPLPEFATTGAWGAGDVILLSGRGMRRVAASGGELVPVTAAADTSEETHQFPQFLPDGRHYFYLASTAGGQLPTAYVGALDSADRRPLPGITSEVKYSSSGHVLFLREGALMAQPFDVERLELSGEPFLVVDRLSASTAVAGAFSVSANGTMAYRAASARSDSQLTWMDRTGTPVGIAGPPGRYADIELAPNGRFVVFEAGGGALGSGSRAGDIWVLDIENGVTSRITSDPARDDNPVWSADGKAIAFRADRDGGHLYQRAFGAVAEDALVFKGQTRESPDHWSPDGRFLIYTTADNDVYALPMTGDRTPVPVATTKFRESDGRVSPDGRWIAYVSNESGRNEIHVQSFPDATLKQPVSTAGGGIPRWSHDGRELYYVAPGDTLMAIAIKPSRDGLSVAAPTRLFQAQGLQFAEGSYAVSSTGRFLVSAPLAERTRQPITVILNWASGLRAGR
ncbi:MAG: hypothetical protein ACT4QD_12840, partial [Acidobacteriota bacterium]